MKKVVSTESQDGLITVDELVHKGNVEKLLIVSVYKNNVSILIDGLARERNDAGMFELGTDLFSGVSITKRGVLEKLMNDPSCPTYCFDSLKEFAEKVIEEGWELPK